MVPGKDDPPIDQHIDLCRLFGNLDRNSFQRELVLPSFELGFDAKTRDPAATDQVGSWGPEYAPLYRQLLRSASTTRLSTDKPMSDETEASLRSLTGPIAAMDRFWKCQF